MHAVVKLVKPAEAFYEITAINKYENPTYAFKAKLEAYDNRIANKIRKGDTLYIHNQYIIGRSNLTASKPKSLVLTTAPSRNFSKCTALERRTQAILRRTQEARLLILPLNGEKNLRMTMMSVRHLNIFSRRIKTDQER